MSDPFQELIDGIAEQEKAIEKLPPGMVLDTAQSAFGCFLKPGSAPWMVPSYAPTSEGCAAWEAAMQAWMAEHPPKDFEPAQPEPEANPSRSIERG